ncbi:hypothetical protein, partial [Burkholderia aenigmatica]|uniref:hypothetical protein n=1 Tax=Burkholderia aenigmatica TaxID=2015348 RepID=UPI002653B44A
VAEIGGKGAVAFGDGNPPPSTKLEFRKDSSFYRGDNYFAAGGVCRRAMWLASCAVAARSVARVSGIGGHSFRLLS